MQLAMGLLRGGHKYLEGLIGGDLVAFHQDAFGLTDDVAVGEGMFKVCNPLG